MDLFQLNSVFQIILIVQFFLIKEYSCACNLTAVNECTTILSRSTDGSVSLDGISPIPAVDQLTKICGSMTEFKACYEPKSLECTKDISFSMTFGTIENTIDYLCVDGYEAILEHATCWNQTGVSTETTLCHLEQNRMISELQTQQMQGNINSTSMRALWCQILDNTTSCMQDAVSTRCGSVPGCIMRTMMTRALKGLAGLMKCPSPETCEVQTHSDGTVHSEGDQHSDHSNDHGHAHAHPEITSDPDNGANTAVLHLFTCFLSLYSSIMYFK